MARVPMRVIGVVVAGAAVASLAIYGVTAYHGRQTPTAVDALPPKQLPLLVTMNAADVMQSWQRVHDGDEVTLGLVSRLKADADKALHDDIRSVTDKAAVFDQDPELRDRIGLPKDFDMHSYVSLATYAGQDGKPNPDVKKVPDLVALQGDKDRAGLINGASTLAMAYYVTGHRAYAERSAEWLRTWFVSSDTRMKPSLEYAQLKAGETQGQGVIDTHNLPQVLDAASLIGASGELSDQDQAGIKQWFADYLEWLVSSTPGQREGDEAIYPNNRGTWYRAQVVAVADYLGRSDVARQYAEQGRRLIDRQITVDGKQPYELARTDSWTYSYLNVLALERLALAAQPASVDLVHYRNRQGAGIEKALRFLVPYGIGERPWENITYPDPVTGKEAVAAQKADVRPELLSLPGAIGARMYPADGDVSRARTQLKPTPASELAFPR